jgi:hypothetical protein
MDELPSLNCGHCLVNPNRFGVDITHFAVVDVRVLSVFWCGSSVTSEPGLIMHF